jgi:hypothetical protein
LRGQNFAGHPEHLIIKIHRRRAGRVSGVPSSWKMF